MKRLIGLTGGVAAGKSEASNILKELGACIVDADEIAREAAEDPEIKEKLKETWPQAFSQNTLDRKHLGRIIFSSKVEREKLNKIVHPWILMHCLGAIKKCPEEICVLVAPLLVENGLDSMVDEIWVIDAPEELRLKRVMEREKISKDEALQMLRSQLSSEEKRDVANSIIENNGSLEALRKTLKKKWESIKNEK